MSTNVINPKVIVVEDNDDESHLLRLWIAKLRPEKDVLIVSSIQEVVCILQQMADPGATVKLIITDYRLGEHTALDFLKMLKDEPRTSGIPVVVWSSAMLKEAGAVIEAGAKRFVLKPVDANENRELLAVLLRDL